MSIVEGTRVRSLGHSTANSTTPSAETKPRESEARRPSAPNGDSVRLSGERDDETSSRVSSIVSGLGSLFDSLPVSNENEGGAVTGNLKNLKPDDERRPGGIAGAFQRVMEALKPPARGALFHSLDLDPAEIEKGREVRRGQEASVTEALDGNRPVEFKNRNGDTFDLSLEETGQKRGVTSYSLELDGQSVDLHLDEGFDHQKLLANFAQNYSDIPESLRGQLKEVNFHDQSIDEGQAYPRRDEGITLNFDRDDMVGFSSVNRFREKFDSALTNY